MIRLIAWFLIQMIGAAVAHAAEATPSDMYAQAVRIEREVEVLKQHLKVSGKAHVVPKAGDLKPRHIRATSYILLFKLGKLRRQHGLTYIQPGDSEPALETKPAQPWGTLQRVLTEVQVIKYYLDIPGQAAAATPVSGKRTVDVYNKLHQISAELDLLTGPITPNETYAAAKRVNEDVDAVLGYLRIFEKAIPPPRKANLLPADSLRAVFTVIGEVQRIQRLYGMEITDFKGFDMGDRATPDDVFGLIALTLAEWQQVQARLGMTHHITAPATYEEYKEPADVVQLLGYTADKLRQIGQK
ncbi:MAG: hypothetical protein PHU46_07660 [Rhodocyclaceae bacterium]|nr:hypothetical protein [Rhodocyclaceae bacterium]